MLNRKSIAAGLVVVSASVTNAHAAGLDFIDDTANALYDAFDSAAIIIVALAIIIAAVGMLFGGMRGETAARVIFGGVIIGAALSISTFLVGLSG